MFYLSAGPPGRLSRKGLVLVFDTAAVRQQCLEFAASYPTPNVRLAVQYAESGRITWEQVYRLFGHAMGQALDAAQAAEVSA